jgi:hypothetical protein
VGLFLPSFSGILKRVSLSFLNYFDKLYIMAADVDLVQVGWLSSWACFNGLKPFPLTFLLLQITGPNLLWAVKVKSGVFFFGPGLVWCGRKNRPLHHQNKIIGNCQKPNKENHYSMSIV